MIEEGYDRVNIPNARQLSQSLSQKRGIRLGKANTAVLAHGGVALALEEGEARVGWICVSSDGW